MIRLLRLAPLILLAACASQRSIVLSPQAVVLDLPIEHQDELYECGLVAVSALCQYHGVQIPPEERARLAQLAADKQGLSGAELQDALQRLGFEVFLFEGTLGDGPTSLKHNVDARRPLLVMTAGVGANHYCLLIGHDAGTDSLILLDPRRGRVVLPTASFAKGWDEARRFTLLAVPEHTPVARAADPAPEEEVP